jgi:hypothetical protein
MSTDELENLCNKEKIPKTYDALYERIQQINFSAENTQIFIKCLFREGWSFKRQLGGKGDYIIYTDYDLFTKALIKDKKNKFNEVTIIRGWYMPLFEFIKKGNKEAMEKYLIQPEEYTAQSKGDLSFLNLEEKVMKTSGSREREREKERQREERQREEREREKEERERQREREERERERQREREREKKPIKKRISSDKDQVIEEIKQLLLENIGSLRDVKNKNSIIQDEKYTKTYRTYKRNDLPELVSLILKNLSPEVDEDDFSNKFLVLNEFTLEGLKEIHEQFFTAKKGNCQKHKVIIDILLISLGYNPICHLPSIPVKKPTRKSPVEQKEETDVPTLVEYKEETDVPTLVEQKREKPIKKRISSDKDQVIEEIKQLLLENIGSLRDVKNKNSIIQDEKYTKTYRTYKRNDLPELVSLILKNLSLQVDEDDFSNKFLVLNEFTLEGLKEIHEQFFTAKKGTCQKHKVIIDILLISLGYNPICHLPSIPVKKPTRKSPVEQKEERKEKQISKIKQPKRDEQKLISGLKLDESKLLPEKTRCDFMNPCGEGNVCNLDNNECVDDVNLQSGYVKAIITYKDGRVNNFFGKKELIDELIKQNADDIKNVSIVDSQGNQSQKDLDEIKKLLDLTIDKIEKQQTSEKSTIESQDSSYQKALVQLKNVLYKSSEKEEKEEKKRKTSVKESAQEIPMAATTGKPVKESAQEIPMAATTGKPVKESSELENILKTLSGDKSKEQDLKKFQNATEQIIKCLGLKSR